MRKLLLLSVVAAVSLAQGKPAVVPARDAGVAAPRVFAVDAGVPAMAVASGTSEVEKLRKELNDLKLRTTELERQQQAKAEALGTDFERVVKKVDELRSQVKVLTDAEDRRVDAEEAAATKKVATAAAAASLTSALSVLATGSTTGIEPSLRYAEAVFTGNAQKDVQLARSALTQGDLSAARQLLLIALFESENQK